MLKKTTKLGHQAPKGWRLNRFFNFISIDGDYAYCASHNFLYNTKVEEEKLYNGLPCYYTDNRYYDTRHNYYKNAYLYWSRGTSHNSITLKSCIRRTLKCRNIPVGTLVHFDRDWYFTGKKIDPGFQMKVKKENKFDPKYEINDPEFTVNFNTCEFSKKLTDALRQNGFIVKVKNTNPDFLLGMVAIASMYTNGTYKEPEPDEGEMAIAYGHGMKIGYSSRKDTFMGYSNGCDNILYDYLGDFDKWSRCYEISKDTPIDEIIKILLEPMENED